MKAALQGVTSITIKQGSVQAIKNVVVLMRGPKKDVQRSVIGVRTLEDVKDQSQENGRALPEITIEKRTLRKEIGRVKEKKETGMQEKTKRLVLDQDTEVIVVSEIETEIGVQADETQGLEINVEASRGTLSRKRLTV
jgi:hypothetical protein